MYEMKYIVAMRTFLPLCGIVDPCVLCQCRRRAAKLQQFKYSQVKFRFHQEFHVFLPYCKRNTDTIYSQSLRLLWTFYESNLFPQRTSYPVPRSAWMKILIRKIMTIRSYIIRI